MRFPTVIRIIVVAAVTGVVPDAAFSQTQRPYSETFRECLDDAVSTRAMIDCHKPESERWERQLNALYKRLLLLFAEHEQVDPSSAIQSGVDIAYPRGATRSSLLQNAQKAWTAFRDADCLSARIAAAGGTDASVYAVTCRLDHLIDRTLTLESRLEDNTQR